MASSPTFRAVPASRDSVVWALLLVAAGVLVMLGVGYRLLDGHFRPDVDYHHLLFVVALFPSLVRYETDIVTLLASLPAAFLLAAVAARIADRGQA